MTPDSQSGMRPGWDDETITRLLDRGVADVTDAPAPVQVVVDDGNRVVRRRRRAVAACSALAVGVVALTTSLLATTGDSASRDQEPDVVSTATPSADIGPSVPTGPNEAAPLDVSAIQGRWVIDSMRDNGLVDGRFMFTDDVIEPEDFTMTFAGDMWTAKTGCYFESAQFDLAGGEFSTGDTMTGSGSSCAQDTHERDWIANISNVMMRADRITETEDGRLSLTSDGDVVATLSPAVGPEPTEPGDAGAADLAGRWDVVIPGLIVNGESQVDTYDDVPMTLEFTTDGRFSATDGCKDLDGDYSVAGRDVALHFIVPAVACVPREPPLAQILGEVRHATNGPHGQIYLHAENYEIILVLKPSSGNN